MVGSLSLYVAAAPEYGKETFHERMTREIAQLKRRYPEALYLGIADGASTHWTFLKQHTERQLFDDYHTARCAAVRRH
ncbi:hypothetical protein [Rhabdochromatium marinum]|uniref:hypothetical protein n=1 Tax=Rhabdochromatium marinum TaxID=48729 RepID=UPI0019038356|nr:hypothetical protein [Rhabdochromatium marinum]MBK1647117.1 hypothetical protein [Rhabdochromatium marinum]